MLACWFSIQSLLLHRTASLTTTLLRNGIHVYLSNENGGCEVTRLLHFLDRSCILSAFSIRAINILITIILKSLLIPIYISYLSLILIFFFFCLLDVYLSCLLIYFLNFAWKPDILCRVHTEYSRYWSKYFLCLEVRIVILLLGFLCGMLCWI